MSDEHIERLSVDIELQNAAKRCGSNITTCSGADSHIGPCSGTNGHVCGGGADNHGNCASLVTCRPSNHETCTNTIGGCNIAVGCSHCAVPI